MTNTKRQSQSFVLVYQAGIANVFRVEGLSLLGENRRKTERIYQGDFRGAYHMGIGLAAAGARVRTAICNRAGDVAGADWTAGLADCPFRDSAHRVHAN
jgi:hypothetical protein